MVAVRILQSVGGLDFSWAPGQVVELPEDEAEKWADGRRGEYVTPPETLATPGESADEEELVEPESKPARKKKKG